MEDFIYLQHDGESGKCTLRAGTVPLDLLVRGHAARLRDVPRHAARAGGIQVVGACLSAEAGGVQTHEGDIEGQDDDGEPEVHDDSDQPRDEEEEADDGDGDVVVGQSEPGEGKVSQRSVLSGKRCGRKKPPRNENTHVLDHTKGMAGGGFPFACANAMTEGLELK